MSKPKLAKCKLDQGFSHCVLDVFVVLSQFINISSEIEYMEIEQNRMDEME